MFFCAGRSPSVFFCEVVGVLMRILLVFAVTLDLPVGSEWSRDGHLGSLALFLVDGYEPKVLAKTNFYYLNNFSSNSSQSDDHLNRNLTSQRSHHAND